MCGILGVVGTGAAESARPLPLDLLRHRGPDGEGRFDEPGVSLGIRRLAIIDLQTGDQPLANESGDVICVVNGEIYNHVELRRELESQGHRFTSFSDVSVVPHLYEQHGDDFVSLLRGMFAIALWDRRRRRLLLVRDRLGIKPLYVADTGGGIAFASEIEPLLALGISDEPDTQAIADYLSYGWMQGETTGFGAVRQLRPGGMLTHDDGRITEQSWWDLTPPDRREGVAPTSDIEEALREAVRIHLRSDVPIGVLLSGGLDSSLIASYAAEELGGALRTFTVGFDDATFDERAPARAVARSLGTRHQELVVSPEVAADLPTIVARLEQPLADPAAIPLWYLSRAVGAEVKVALAGDGGDEVFGGYSRYAWDGVAGTVGRVLPARAIASLLEAMPGVRRRARSAERRDPLRRAVKLLRNAELPQARRYFSWFALMSEERIGELVGVANKPAARCYEQLFAESPVGLSARGRLQAVDLRAMLADDLLLKADKLSMAHSLELRVPFLDHEVVRRGLFLADREKLRGVRTKVALRRIAAKRLPPGIAGRPKQGFDIPIDTWLRGELRPLAEQCIRSDALSDLVDRNAAERLLSGHLSGEYDAGAGVYALVVLALWRERVRSGRALALAGR